MKKMLALGSGLSVTGIAAAQTTTDLTNLLGGGTVGVVLGLVVLFWLFRRFFGSD